jgi:acyl-coenzyme A thioesterase PaaI-like protein
VNPRTVLTRDDSTVLLAHIMSDHETNLYGAVHGGMVMKLIDDAAGLVFVAVDRDRRSVPQRHRALRPYPDARAAHRAIRHARRR